MSNIAMKGTVTAVVTNGSTIEIWVASPTGDSSDTHIFEMPCVNETQADVISNMWRTVWGIKS